MKNLKEFACLSRIYANRSLCATNLNVHHSALHYVCHKAQVKVYFVIDP